MTMFKLPESLVVRRGENKVKSDCLWLTIDAPSFECDKYRPFGPNAIWRLLAALSNLEENMFFEIERKDIELIFQGYKKSDKFCLFQDTYEASIKLFGAPELDMSNLNLTEVTDGRWEIIYFLPEAAFCAFEDIVRMGTHMLQTGQLADHIDLSQRLPDLGLPLATP